MTDYKVCALDVETGGLDVDQCAVLQIGVVEWWPERSSPPREYSIDVVPGEGLEVSVASMQVNGWAGVPRGARSEAEACHWVFRRLFGARFVVGHWLRYDFGVMRAMHERCGALWVPPRGVCSLIEARRILSGRSGSWSLDALTQERGVRRDLSPSGHHDAVLDARAALELLVDLAYDGRTGGWDLRSDVRQNVGAK